MTTPDPGDVTLASYVARPQEYLAHSRYPSPTVTAYLGRFAGLVGAGHVLELGSGPGWDALHLESLGLRVTCTDASPAFVDLLRAAGRDAALLDIRTGDLGGPFDGVLADAVLLHLTRRQLAEVLPRIRAAVMPAGFFACTVKEGDGEAWTTAKLGLPRHFTFWREPDLRALLERSGWRVLSVERVAGQAEHWLFVLAQAPDPDETRADTAVDVDVDAHGPTVRRRRSAASPPARHRR